MIKIGKLEFDKIPHTGMDGKVTVSFVEKSDKLNPFKFVVSREGLHFEGEMKGRIVTQQDLQDFAKLLGEIVWAEKMRHDPKIHSTIAGH